MVSYCWAELGLQMVMVKIRNDHDYKYKERVATPKRMNSRKSSKRPLTPPSFSENYIADFATKMRQKCVCSLWRECYNINVLYDPISHEMHVVQQFNMVIG